MGTVRATRSQHHRLRGCYRRSHCRHGKGRGLDIARLADAYAYFRGRYFRDNDFTHHYDGLRLRGKSDREELVKSVLTGGTNEPAEVAVGVLIIVYRFRNNLHHGLKWAYGIQGQREKFEQSNAVLTGVMEM